MAKVQIKNAKYVPVMRGDILLISRSKRKEITIKYKGIQSRKYFKITLKKNSSAYLFHPFIHNLYHLST